VTFDPEDLSTLKAEATIQVTSIDTGIERRDNHLRSDDFFNAEQFPEMKFVSKSVRNIDGESFELVGDLTIRDITKEVVLEGEFYGVGMMGETRKAGFQAETTVNRFDYNLKWDRLTEAGGLVVAEEVKITLDLELNEVTEQAGE
jgi:polyisoprenoid-binding protein YceI